MTTDSVTNQVVSGKDNNGKAITTTVIVGQQVNLMAVVPQGLVMTSVQWTIPGETVAGYTQSQAAATAEYLTDADLAANPLTFYWIAAGSETVTCDYKVSGVVRQMTAVFTVLAPTARFTATITTERSPVDVGPDLKHDLSMSLHLGTAKEGIDWSGTVTTVAGEAGQIATTQTICTDRLREDNAGNWTSFCSASDYICDDYPEEPHDGGYVNDESWASIGASSTAKAEAADSPFEAMETGYKFYNVDDDFENYLMYRPSGTNSIWVTLSVIEWHWDGSATYANNRWSLDPGSHPNKPGQGIKGSASTSLPEWDSYFGILKYR